MRSIQFYKRVITWTVVGLILGLTVAVVCLSLILQKKNAEYNTFFGVETELADYQTEYKNLYVENEREYKDYEDKTVYLTFDDGPALGNTDKVLDALKKYDAKATFFVVYHEGEEYDALYKRIVDEGHTIGVHTASHQYKKIYSSVDAYMEDFNKVATHVEDVTGYKPYLFRFPGGSSNTYNQETTYQIQAELLRRGYTFFDWNVSSGDAVVGGLPVATITYNVVYGVMNWNGTPVVLLHDGYGKETTADAVEGILKTLSKEGYKFKALDDSCKPVVFAMPYE